MEIVLDDLLKDIISWYEADETNVNCIFFLQYLCERRISKMSFDAMMITANEAQLELYEVVKSFEELRLNYAGMTKKYNGTFITDYLRQYHNYQKDGRRENTKLSEVSKMISELTDEGELKKPMISAKDVRI